MTFVLVDTNAAIVANGNADHVTRDCMANCLRRLMEIRSKQQIVLDSCGLILKEYLKYNPHGTPRGPGDQFMVWAYDNQENKDVCLKAHVTPKQNSFLSSATDADDPDLEEFPDDGSLNDFDRQDRKFVAAAIASNVDPIVVNASDSDWKKHELELAGHGVRLEHICL